MLVGGRGRVLKIDLHTHSSDDPVDSIAHTSAHLVDRAADLGFDALAITLHDRQLDLRGLVAGAQERGIVLIRGVERTIQGRHVLLLNFPVQAELVNSFESLAGLKVRHPEGIVIAPHPFYPHPSRLGRLMDRDEDLFDAVEINAFYTAMVDFNRAARRWARTHRKPLVANSDAHDLSIFGRSFSLVDAEKEPSAICAAIKRGQVQLQTRPLSTVEAATYLARMTLRRCRPSAPRRSVPASV